MKISTLFICMSTFINLFGQLNSTRLNHNNVSAFISDGGTFFYDYENQEKGYEVPRGSGVHALKSMQFWFAAKDTNGQIYFSQGGIPGQGSDIFNGPISDPGTYGSQQYQNNWDKSVWPICQSAIDNYTLNYNCNQDPDCDDYYPITNEELNQISNWPAHGDVALGQSFYLAPYYDNPGNNGSGDGIYDPSQGDIPIIKGCCATYTIQNDEAQPHTLTNTYPIGIELHIMFYQYRTWDYLNNVTFVDIKAINHSGQDYPEFIHSVAINAALGNETDDFLGCDSLSNTMYFYNAGNNDENGPTSLGYGQNPPAIGIVGLNHDMTSCVPYSGNESVTEKWNLMKGLQTNGNPWMHPDGFETKYVYSGNPNNSAEWSELGVGNTAGIAQGLLSIDLGVFNDGDTLSQSYAIVYARDGNHLKNVESVIDNAINVKSFYVNESDIPCTDGTWDLEEQNNLNISVTPNPSSGIIHVKNPNMNNLSISVFDLQGKVIEKESMSNHNVIDIDLSERQSGIYLVHIRLQDKMVVKKIIIR